MLHILIIIYKLFLMLQYKVVNILLITINIIHNYKYLILNYHQTNYQQIYHNFLLYL